MIWYACIRWIPYDTYSSTSSTERYNITAILRVFGAESARFLFFWNFFRISEKPTAVQTRPALSLCAGAVQRTLMYHTYRCCREFLEHGVPLRRFFFLFVLCYHTTGAGGDLPLTNLPPSLFLSLRDESTEILTSVCSF